MTMSAGDRWKELDGHVVLPSSLSHSLSFAPSFVCEATREPATRTLKSTRRRRRMARCPRVGGGGAAEGG